MVEEQYKEKIISLINALIPDAAIYIFGSRARGTNAPQSDIDIALDAGRKLSHVDVGEVRNVLEATYIPYRMDVVDFNGVSSLMRQAILEERVIWKANS